MEGGEQWCTVCPRCEVVLTPAEADARLSSCVHCGGHFLERGAPTALLGSGAEPPAFADSFACRELGESPLSCPHGHGPLIAFDLAFRGREVEVDVCEDCDGLWLDAGEGERLRSIAYDARDVAQRVELGLEGPGVASYFFQLMTGFPIEVWNPVRRRTWLVYALVVALMVLFGVQMAGGENFERLVLLVPATVVEGRRPWTLVTSAFFHSDVWHLLANVYFLYIFGDNVEDTFRRRRFATIYGVSLLGAAFAHVLTHPNSTAAALGASGAIAGVMGAYVMLFPRVRVHMVVFFWRFQLGIVWYLVLWIAAQALLAFVTPVATAWLAHVGGLTTGAAIAVWYARYGK